MLKKIFRKNIKNIFRKNDLVSELTRKAIKANSVSRRIIVFPEIDATIIKACSVIIRQGIATPIILGPENKINSMAAGLGIKNFTQENIFDYLSEIHKTEFSDFKKSYLDMMNSSGHNMTEEEAGKKLSEPHYYGAMMVNSGLANGMITGINSETKPYHPAFEIKKTRPGINRASGLFIMISPEGKTYFLQILD